MEAGRQGPACGKESNELERQTQPKLDSAKAVGLGRRNEAKRSAEVGDELFGRATDVHARLVRRRGVATLHIPLAEH